MNVLTASWPVSIPAFLERCQRHVPSVGVCWDWARRFEDSGAARIRTSPLHVSCSAHRIAVRHRPGVVLWSVRRSAWRPRDRLQHAQHLVQPRDAIASPVVPLAPFSTAPAPTVVPSWSCPRRRRSTVKSAMLSSWHMRRRSRRTSNVRLVTLIGQFGTRTMPQCIALAAPGSQMQCEGQAVARRIGAATCATRGAMRVAEA